MYVITNEVKDLSYPKRPITSNNSGSNRFRKKIRNGSAVSGTLIRTNRSILQTESTTRMSPTKQPTGRI